MFNSNQLLDSCTNFLDTLWNQISLPIKIILPVLLLSSQLFLFLFLFLQRSDSIPGSFLYTITKWRLALDDYLGTRTRTIHNLHQIYGPIIRLSPKELSFSTLSALKTIYGAGSGFHRTSFYSMFDVYGQPNLFTFPTVSAHAERKKLLAHAYSKSCILKTGVKGVEEKVWEFMELIEKEPDVAGEVFGSLHYYALDNITHFLYGEEFGGTKALRGEAGDRKMLGDILDPSRRKLAWFAAHLPRYTKWLMSRMGYQEKAVEWLKLLPQKKPTVYTGIRNHAFESWKRFLHSSEEVKASMKSNTIIGRLWESHISQKARGMKDLEIASEVADHLLAGVDTTSDTLMFLIWALSLPENTAYQERLIEEVSKLSDSDLNIRGIPTAEATLKLTYLDAVIKETLRLYAPLPASEPRCLPRNCVIDGYHVPANTVVSMSPYTLHRNAAVFPQPLVFNPERWLGDAAEVAEMKKWFWAFSSGGRMCIGIHLAMVEMTMLTAAIYRKYKTRVKPGTEDISPGITSRFEVFYDETKERMKEHECWIDFEPR